MQCAAKQRPISCMYIGGNTLVKYFSSVKKLITCMVSGDNGFGTRGGRVSPNGEEGRRKR